MVDRIRRLSDDLAEFARERDWKQFHTPKNLVMALSVEVAELVEIFQWLTPEESADLSEGDVYDATLEMGDVFIYLLQLADSLGIDLMFADQQKLLVNHTPNRRQNLAMALSVEVAKLVEIFQWLTPEESADLSCKAADRATDEVFIFLLQLADSLGIDLMFAAQQKLLVNQANYPVEESRGRASR